MQVILCILHSLKILEEIQLAPTNAIALAVLAHQLQMEEFQNICVAYVKDTLGYGYSPEIL